MHRFLQLPLSAEPKVQEVESDLIRLLLPTHRVEKETDGLTPNPPKQTTTERGSGKSLEKCHKRRNQLFGDVSKSQT